MAIGVACAGVVIVCFCFVSLVCSLAFFSLGTIALITVLPYFHIDPAIEFEHTPEFTTQLWTLVGISGVGSLLAFIFCCFSVKLKQCGIVCVAMILTAALIGEQVMMTKMYYDREEALQQIQHSLNNSLTLYNETAEVALFWNNLQTNLKCCGLEGPTDWSTVYGNSTTLPTSCCEEEKPCFVGSSNIWDGSCGKNVAHQFHDKMIAMFSITLAISIIEGIAAIACLLACCCLVGTRVIIS